MISSSPMFRRVAYRTSLPAAECLTRLRKTCAEHPWSIRRIWTPLPEGTVQATVWGHRFALSAWPPRYTRSSFGPVLYASLRGGSAGTSIQGRFILHPAVMCFLAVWFSGVFVGLALALHVLASELGQTTILWARALAPLVVTLAVLAFGCVLVRHGIRAGRGQRERIEEYVGSVLEADTLSPNGVPQGGA